MKGRKNQAPPTPFTLCDSPIETVELFLPPWGTSSPRTSSDFSSLTRNAQQRMYFLRQLKKFN